MKIECIKKDLEEAVDINSRIISNNATLPVLTCVIFEAKDTTVTLKSTNLEISIEKKISCNVIKDGVVAIPAHILLSTLKTSQNQTKCTLEQDEGSIILTIGESKTTINTIPTDEFPKLPKPETKTKHIIPKTTLTTGIKNVLYSASTSLIKPELSSVFIYQEGDSLFFVATDSFRLAEQKVLFTPKEDVPPVIIPIKNTTELLKILETQLDGDIEVYIDENQYAIKKEGLFVTLRIIDGSFPDYKSILPKEVKTEVVVLKNDLFQTLKKAQLFSDNFGQVNLHIYPKKKTFTVSSRNTTVGEVFDSLDAVITGDELDISFNYKYLLDVFHSIQTDSVSLKFSGENKPLIIKGVGNKDFTYLVMPMNR